VDRHRNCDSNRETCVEEAKGGCAADACE